MKVKYLLSSLLPLIAVLSHAQKGFEDEWIDYICHSVTVETDSSKIKAHVLEESSDIKIDNETYYYSYNNREISRIRGGILGKVLHDEYQEMDHEGNIMRGGKFRFGQRHGEWKEWYDNGELKRVERLNKGKLEGNFKEYNFSGRLLREGAYKDGKLHGKVLEYVSSEEVVEKKYKAGILKKTRGIGDQEMLEPRKEENQKKKRQSKQKGDNTEVEAQ